MKTYLLVIIFFGFYSLLFAQNSRTQYGGYLGIGLTNYNENRNAGIGFEIGQSFIIKKKGEYLRRKELYLQFAENHYSFDSRVLYENSYLYDSTYSISDYKIQFFQIGYKLQIPFVITEKYRLLFSPGLFFGSILSYHYFRKWYYFSDNSLQKEEMNTGYASPRIVFGTTFGLQNEIRLKPRLYLHVDINILGQSVFEYASSSTWSSATIRTGLYWYLPVSKK